ncbi:hypothetical protein HMPREF9567_00637 [Cutibacterium acnes HL013PA1]|nr:hypothetical protein HMPREF9567_00637 [Cutibacterium acnes HL013PA1]EGF72495.1 hypothetical protein HMPREF9588_00627 [Cutibacterium acnes HL025PA2]
MLVPVSSSVRANEDPSWKTMMVEVDEHFMPHRFQGCGSD